MEPDVLERIFDGSIGPRDIKLSALKSITDNFSEDRIIGEGGFGTVYKGVLLNGEVAVKRIHSKHTIDEKLFHREVNSLLKVNHKNIVRFIGFCSRTVHKPYQQEGSGEFVLAEHRERLLCFEYINNGSLENYIADELRGLQWDTRYSILKGICEGLQYLHTEKNIMHMDLKPANILIDDYMVAKITDFGLSRMVGNSQTKTTNLLSSPGYTAPEYIDSGTMLVQYDVYSLGIIIIQLVTGQRSIPDTNNVLRRWRHRWHKSGKETPFSYQQIAKLIEIGLQCQETDPYKRPFISKIVSDLNKLESTDRQISNAKESTVGQIIPYPEDDMLGIEPLELHFPIELNNEISCSLELTNDTNAFFAFSIQTTSPLLYRVQPNQDTVAPKSKYNVNITLLPLDHAPLDMQYNGNFIVRSTKVNESLISEGITDQIFNKEDAGKLVDEVNLTITYKAEVPQADVSLGSLTMSDMRNLLGSQECNVSPTEADYKISSCTSDEVIQFVPPELCFPLMPYKKVLSSTKIINNTESYVCFTFSFSKENTANYSRKDSVSILPPRSTQLLTITREHKEDAVKDMQFSDGVFVWYAIVAENIKVSDIGNGDFTEWRQLPIILTKASPNTSNELIQFDPPELSVPFMPNKKFVFSVNIVNESDHCVGFDAYNLQRNMGWFYINPSGGVMPPRSTQRLLVKRIPKDKEFEDMECEDKFFLWSSIVSEDVEAGDFKNCVDYEGSKELPIVYKKTGLWTDELIKFNFSQLVFSFFPNEDVSMMRLLKIFNVTNHSVGFNIRNNPDNYAWYVANPQVGILPPKSTRTIKVIMIPKEKEPEEMECIDKIFVWSGIVSEGVEVSDVFTYWDDKEKELPIVLIKKNLCTSNKLIQFDPPEFTLPFMPNKSLLFSVNIVNSTDHYVGFNLYEPELNVGRYYITPDGGVMPPRSTQKLVVERSPDKKEEEDMQCQDMFYLWNSIVSEGVQASDIVDYIDYEVITELPIVFKRSLCASDELIQVDPPQLPFPFLPNKMVSMLRLFKIVNATDHSVGFNIWSPETNSAWYIIEPSEGILPPLSTRGIKVRRSLLKKEPEDMQCKDKICVWSSIVTEGVVTDFSKYAMQGDKELPVVLTKPGESSSS